MLQTDFFSRCGCESCYHCLRSCASCHHLGDGVRAQQTSSTGATLVSLPRGPIKFIGELTVYTEGAPVAGYPGVCNHEVPLSWVVHVSPHLAAALRAPLGLLVTRQGYLSLCVQEFAIIGVA